MDAIEVTDQSVATGKRQSNRAEQAEAPKHRPSNWRTALVLLSIALAFFVGVIVNHLMYQ